MPLFSVFRHHARQVFAGILVCLATFVLFYLMIVFTLDWGTTALHYNRDTFLTYQLIGTAAFALMIPVSAWLAEWGRKRTMIAVSVAIAAFGFVLAPLFSASAAAR